MIAQVRMHNLGQLVHAGARTALVGCKATKLFAVSLDESVVIVRSVVSLKTLCDVHELLAMLVVCWLHAHGELSIV